MAADCVFCKIVAGQIPSHRVYEDDAAFAFLDIHPLARGHTLVVPRAHAARFEDLTPEQAAALWKAVHRLVPAILGVVGAPATTIALNNGREAGQEVPHVHVHLVPRAAADGVGPIHALPWPRPETTPDELGRTADAIRRGTPRPAARTRAG